MIERFLRMIATAVGIVATLQPAFALALDDSTNSAQQHEPLLTVKRGLSAELRFNHTNPTLQALPEQSIDSEVLIRLERSSAAPNPATHTYEYALSFFGTVAGEYYLRDLIVLADGSVPEGDDRVQPLWVRVVSELPPGQGTSLYEISDPPLSAPRGYRAAILTFAITWLSVPALWFLMRLRNRKPQVEQVLSPPPTLADRLRPLIQRANTDQLSVAEQGQLEMLLYVFWQRRLGLSSSMADALPVMRSHREAGQLLRTLEAWVHAAEPARPELSAETMEALLEPYRASEAENHQSASLLQPGVSA